MTDDELTKRLLDSMAAVRLGGLLKPVHEPNLRPEWERLAEFYNVCEGTLFGVPIENVTADEWRCLAGFFASRAVTERKHKETEREWL